MNKNIEDYQLVEINRLSPASMEYYVSIIDVFGHRGLYHHVKKSDAITHAKILKKGVFLCLT